MSHARVKRIALVCALQCSLVSLTASAPLAASAQDKAAKAAAPAAKKAKKAKVPKADPKTQAAVNKAKAQLASGDHAEVEAGIQSLGLLGVAAAVPPLVERIERGLPKDLLETA